MSSSLTDEAWRICQRYGGLWGSHTDHPVSDWQHEVSNHDTIIGYWDWVVNQIEQAKEEADNE